MIDPVLIGARSALLDALEALAEQRDSIIVVGAQAVFLRTGHAPAAVAETTKDSDLAVDPRRLRDDPLIEQAMLARGFSLNPESPQPGAWLSRAGVPVDLMVPAAFAGGGGRSARGARIPPHDKRATREPLGSKPRS